MLREVKGFDMEPHEDETTDGLANVYAKRLAIRLNGLFHGEAAHGLGNLLGAFLNWLRSRLLATGGEGGHVELGRTR